MLLQSWVLLSLGALSRAGEPCRIIRETMMSCLDAKEKDIPTTTNQKVQWITFKSSEVPKVHKGFLKHYPKLTDFHAEDTKIEKIEPDAFKGLAGINWIDVSQNKIKAVDEKLIVEGVKMDHFNISGNTDLAIPKHKPFLKSKSLKWLDISSCAIRELYAESLAELPSLRDLSLARNLLKTLPDDIFKNNRGLLSLDITDNKFKSLSGSIFTGLRVMVLRFEDNPWNCDCHLSSLLIWSKRNVVKGDVKCDKPHNKKWKEIINPAQPC